MLAIVLLILLVLLAIYQLVTPYWRPGRVVRPNNEQFAWLFVLIVGLFFLLPRL